MHFQFLIEDNSGEVLVRQVVNKLEKEGNVFTFDAKHFGGIGGFKQNGKIKNVRTNKLLNNLPRYLTAFDKTFANYEGCVIVVLDNDERDPDEFRQQLHEVAEEAGITVDHVFCIAVEEMEAWLLGDWEALLQAYPNARETKYKEYVQDSICGTWEKLADIIYQGGLTEFRKDCPTGREAGKYKAEWAEKIGEYMNLDVNRSPSFRSFVKELRCRMN